VGGGGALWYAVFPLRQCGTDALGSSPGLARFQHVCMVTDGNEV
jgi:hypothetical protein